MVKTLQSPWLHPLSLFLGALLSIGIWGVFFIHVLYWDWLPALLNASLLTGTWMFAFLLIHNLLLYYFPRGWNQVYLFLGVWVLGGAWWLSYESLRMLLMEAYEPLFTQAILVSEGLLGTLFLQLWTLVRCLWQMLEEQATAKDLERQALQFRKEAELHHLRQQLQPHFLFNSLNSISALVGHDTHRAREMTSQLADFLRTTLQHDQQELIPLQQELDRIQLYLNIERTRFGPKLQLETQVDASCLDLSLPALTLQPLLENAVKYGWLAADERCLISLKAHPNGHYLEITIQNPTTGKSSGKGTGFGLESLRRRLFLLYARKDLLTTDCTDGIFTVRLLIPQAI